MDFTALFKQMDLPQALLFVATITLWIRFDKQRLRCEEERNQYLIELVSVKSEMSYVKGFLQGQGLAPIISQPPVEK